MKNTSHLVFGAALALFISDTPSKAAVVALYTFPTSAGTTMPSLSVDTDSNSTASGFSANAALSPVLSIGSGNPPGSITGISNNSGEGTAFTATKFFSWDVTPVSGTLSLSSLDFDYFRDTAAAPGNFALYANTSGSFTSGVNVGTGTTPGSVGFWTSGTTLSLSGVPSLQNVSSKIFLRLYIWGGNGTDRGRYDNITLHTVPEPSLAVLFLSGGAVFCLLRRRVSCMRI